MGSVIPISSRQMMQPLLMGLNVEVALVEGNKFLTRIAISGNQVAGITCENTKVIVIGAYKPRISSRTRGGL